MSVPLIGAFALLHGYSHGVELPANASALSYGAGFIAATLALHLLGNSVGLSGPRAGPFLEPASRVLQLDQPDAACATVLRVLYLVFDGASITATSTSPPRPMPAHSPAGGRACKVLCCVHLLARLIY